MGLNWVDKFESVALTMKHRPVQANLLKYVSDRESGSPQSLPV